MEARPNSRPARILLPPLLVHAVCLSHTYVLHRRPTSRFSRLIESDAADASCEVVSPPANVPRCARATREYARDLISASGRRIAS